MERYHGGTMQGGPRLKVISVYFGQTPAVEESRRQSDGEVPWRICKEAEAEGRRCLFWSDTLAIEGSRWPRDREVLWRNYVRRPRLR